MGGLGTVRGVPIPERVVLGGAMCPNNRSWDSVKCPNTKTKGAGRIRSVPTLGRRVLGQCEVSKHLSERSWDSVNCPNTRTKGLGTVRSVPILAQRGLGTVRGVPTLE